MKRQLDYQKIAREIVKRETENLVKTITKGQCPDLHWKLEIAIADALKYVANLVEKETKMAIFEIIKDFDNNDGPTNN